MTPTGYFLYDEHDCAWMETHAGTLNAIPLYTHPAKTLTDEEMYDLLSRFQGIELCKEILKKAREK